jgi:hypothetical protein
MWGIRFLLILGVIIGFGSELHRRAHWHHEAYERHWAQVCLDAAKGDKTQAAPEPVR